MNISPRFISKRSLITRVGLIRMATALSIWNFRLFFQSRNFVPLLMVGLTSILVIAPLIMILLATLTPNGLEAWQDITYSHLSRNLWWKPLGNSLLLGVGVAAGCLLLGGFLAWLVVMTDVPMQRFLGVLSLLPFMIPSFAAALAWSTLFRNERLGGQAGYLVSNGYSIPDWLAWGLTPTLIVLIAHYYSLAYAMIAASLSSVSADLVESAEMAGAKRSRILFGIVLPIVTPALISGGMLTFAGAVSNFASPALLGAPVRMQTISTRLYGMAQTGNMERAYVLALLLMIVAAALLYFSDRLVSGRRSFVTVTGKGARTRRFSLGRWRWPLFALAVALGVITTIIPVVVLIASSFAPQAGALFSNWTSHFWIGPGGSVLAEGQAGIFRNPILLDAIWTTVRLGLAVAAATMVIGLLVAHTIVRYKASPLSRLLSQLAFLPLFIPSIAMAAAYLAMYGTSFGPIPALYGTFTLIVFAATANLMPYAVQSGRAVLSQISADIEESAKLTGASAIRRMIEIVFPLAVRGIMAGGILVFIKIVRDLSLVVLLFSAATPLLSMLAFNYAGLGFMQFANAITLVIMAICLIASLLVHLLQKRIQRWKKS
jgi:iron(III) transport system permease protein